jgi:hypothetical protein
LRETEKEADAKREASSLLHGRFTSMFSEIVSTGVMGEPCVPGYIRRLKQEDEFRTLIWGGYSNGYAEK